MCINHFFQTFIDLIIDGSMKMTSFIDFYTFHLLNTPLNTFAKSHGTVLKKKKRKEKINGKLNC